ncbi:unnamed protein product [Lepidochelys kempii]
MRIHKPGNPGLPIISGIGTLTAGLSGYVDSLLRPYAPSAPSYLRDTTDFLRKLQSMGDLPENTILATMDVEALYTIISHKDGLQASRNTIPDNVTANLVAERCDFVLIHNYFTFGDNVYLQISGTAMGTRMAPQYANIFMADLEQRFLSSRPLTPLLYLRYIDDLFIIWTHGKEALEEFHHDFNNFHPTINLSLDQSTQVVHFLDTTVLISDGHINTTLYRKPTDLLTIPTYMPPAFIQDTPHDPLDPFITQASLGCELHPNGTSRGFDDTGVNGEDFISFDADAGKWVARQGDKLALYAQDLLNLDKSTAITLQFLLRMTCVNQIKSFVQHGKESLERQERPVAVVFARAPSPAGTPAPLLLVCWVTGFYPRPIRVAWLQDGEEVGPGGRVSSSRILPNADLTYQLRSSLAVEPGDGHSYACRVEHSSLGGQSLLIPWGHSRGWGPGLAVGITLGALAVAAVAAVLWRSRRRGYQDVGPGESRA